MIFSLTIKVMHDCIANTNTCVPKKGYPLKGPVTPCNFSCNLQRNSTFGKCKIGEYMFPSQFAKVLLTYETFVTNLHLLRVELRCKLQEKLHCVTGPEVKRI